VDTFQETAPQQQSDEAQQVVEENRDKHEIVLDQLKSRLPEKAKPNVERAIEQERKDTQHTKGKKEDQENSGGQDTKQGASPRGQATQRPTNRAQTPRPTPSPRATEKDRDEGD
jgi:hypothetical protein